MPNHAVITRVKSLDSGSGNKEKNDPFPLLDEEFDICDFILSDDIPGEKEQDEFDEAEAA